MTPRVRWGGVRVPAVVGGLLILTAPAARAQACAPDNAGLELPPGFCALVVVDALGAARHFAVADNGDLFVAVPGRRGGDDAPAGVVALRDTDGDGAADVRRVVVSDPNASYVRLHTAPDGSWLYYGTRNAIIRYRRPAGRLAVAGPPDTVVGEIPGGRQHGIKTFAIGPGGRLYVNVGAPSNSCQVGDREPRSPGMDPCPLRDTTAGIWVWDAHRSGQRRGDGRRFATGLRNVVALAVHPGTGRLYGAIHGRDMLGAGWGYSDSANAEKPSEEFVRIDEGDDFGWPYCYHDPELDRKVLAPEYGGDGTTVGRCADVESPLMAFPAHWAPNGLTFSTAGQFPAEYEGGAFLAFHGSWNRAPLPQQGFRVVFVPFAGATPGRWRVFANGFQEIGARPVDVVQGPDGSLYVSDDRGGRVFRILYRR